MFYPSQIQIVKPPNIIRPHLMVQQQQHKMTSGKATTPADKHNVMLFLMVNCIQILCVLIVLMQALSTTELRGNFYYADRANIRKMLLESDGLRCKEFVIYNAEPPTPQEKWDEHLSNSGYATLKDREERSEGSKDHPPSSGRILTILERSLKVTGDEVNSTTGELKMRISLLFEWKTGHGQLDVLQLPEDAENLTEATTTDPHLFKSNSGREREKSDSFRASPRASSSRYERYSSASQLSRALENNPFTYINNSRVFNGETPTRLSFEENTDKQTKENTELDIDLFSVLLNPPDHFRSVPITHLFSSPEEQNIKVGLSLTFPKYLQINYEPGFYKFLRGNEPSFPQCEELKKANKGRINCDYFNEREKSENECSRILNPKKEKLLDNFNERIDKILNCVLKYCAENSKIKSKPGVLEKFYKQFKKGVGSVFGSEDTKWWVGEDEAEHIVIVTNNEVIGAIYEKITGQLMDVESASITKFIEFETNQASSSGSSYKRFRIIQESDIKHLGLSENLYQLNNRIW
uniref:Uncharacterized protein n=1 Tax=Meloidogyne javanica TaxID=6303 RepID=A0A915M858_MELJA